MANSAPLQAVPRELLAFLKRHAGTTVKLTGDADEVEIAELQFKAPDELAVTGFKVGTWEYYTNHDEPGEDPELEYTIPGIDLVSQTEAYDPEGLLVYFSELKEFGFWDPDHLTISLFPDANWQTIEARLSDFVNSQWNSESAESTLLRPWSDERCKHIKGSKEEG